MKYLGYVLLVVGALLVYLSKIITNKILKKDDAEEKINLRCKIVGLFVALAGALIIFI